MLSPHRELHFLKFLDNLSRYLRSIRDPRKAFGHGLRESRAFFAATGGCIAVVEAGELDARMVLTIPRSAAWDLRHIGQFIRHTRPPIRSELMIAPIRRRGATWGTSGIWCVSGSWSCRTSPGREAPAA